MNGCCRASNSSVLGWENRVEKGSGLVAVGPPVTRRPPHRSLRAELPHKAPASGRNAQTRFIYPKTYPCQRTLQPFPALSPLAGLLARLPLANPLFSTNSAVELSRPNFVRRFLRYYGVVRLLRFVHPCSLGIPRADPPHATAAGRSLRSPGFRVRSVASCPGSSTAQPCAPHPGGVHGVAFPLPLECRPPEDNLFRRGSIGPAWGVPLSTLQLCPHEHIHMTRSQCD